MTSLELLTDIAAWVGAVGTVGALVWGIAIWRRSRVLIEVKASVSYFVFDADQISPPFLSITVINKGLDPVTIDNWGVRTRGGNLVALVPNTQSDRLPTRLQTNSSAKYYCEVTEYIAEQARTGLPWKRMRPFAILTTGQEVEGKKGLPNLEPKLPKS